MHHLKSSIFASVIASLAMSNLAIAQTFEETIANAPPIHRVEEDWELQINNPDPNLDIPQVVTVFGPTNAAFDTHTLFELNHGTLPTFGEGGMQLQVWWSDYLVGYLSQQAPVEFNTESEVVSYTTITALDYNNGSHLTMAVKNGSSTTYGTFGSNNSLKVWLFTERSDLNPYDPSNSIRNSRVTFGSNRVQYFKRKAIRFYDENGDLYAEDTSDRFVHQLTSP